MTKKINVISFLSILLTALNKYNNNATHSFKITANDLNEWRDALNFQWQDNEEAIAYGGHICYLSDDKQCPRCLINTLNLTALSIADTFTAIKHPNQSVGELFAFTAYVYIRNLKKGFAQNTTVNTKLAVESLKQWTLNEDTDTNKIDALQIGIYASRFFDELNG